MKKFITVLVLSVATIGLNAAKNDWMSDLDKTLNKPETKKAIKAGSKEAKRLGQKYSPMVEELSIKYGPQIRKAAERLEMEGETLLAKVPAKHRLELKEKALNLLDRAALIAQAQAQNNPALVAQARALLSANKNDLEMVKARVLEKLRNNPDLQAKVTEYVERAKNAAGDSAVMTYVNRAQTEYNNL